MREIVELNGDGIAPELRDAVHALNESLGSPVSFRPVDWTLERREATDAALDEGIELTTALGAAMKTPEVTERYRLLTIEAATTTPEEFGELIKADLARWDKVVKEANIRAP